MSKCRKMLEGTGAGVEKLMRLIETQSLKTLVKWTTDYAKRHFLPIYEKHFSHDDRPRVAIAAARVLCFLARRNNFLDMIRYGIER